MEWQASDMKDRRSDGMADMSACVENSKGRKLYVPISTEPGMPCMCGILGNEG